MVLSWLYRLLKRKSGPVSRTRKKPGKIRFVPAVEFLDERLVPAVTATFLPGAGTLAIFGDALDNRIMVSRDAADKILVNGGAVNILGGTPTVLNTSTIQVFGKGGNDSITLDESNGALPHAFLFGGAGDDTLTGGSGADQLFGEAGNDTLLGKGGADFLFGGAGNDILTAGTGDDQVFGMAGNDRMIWNPGDGSDLNEGGAGIDTVEVNGGNGSEDFLATVVNDRILFQRVNLVPFSITIGTSESLVVSMNGGDDTFSANGTITGLIVDGGDGNDTILGGAGNDTLIGGDGNDFIDGNQGNDVARMGAGDDIFQWDPGDGSDTVEGQDGHDAMVFNGSNLSEKIDISANGQRVRFFRDLGNVTMDLNEMERIDFNVLGGSDMVTVNDLTGTGVIEVNIDLASPAGSGLGDGQADTVIVNGSNGDDAAVVAGDATGVFVLGLATQVHVTGAKTAEDRLVVNALAGDDVVNASGLSADSIQFAADGGDGDDALVGGAGNDTLTGGAGDDELIGGPGQNVLDGGSGDNILL